MKKCANPAQKARQQQKPSKKPQKQPKSVSNVPPPVIIKWADITTYMVWNDSKEEDMCVFETIGFLIEETDEYYKLCDTAPDIGQVTKYPKGCVIEITKLGRKP